MGEALQLAGIPYCYSLATDLQTLQATLGVRLHEAINHFKSTPILHFSAHGNTDGIQLTSGAFLSWADLDLLLKPIHHTFGGGLLICLSSCESWSGMQMAMNDGPERPFWALVSHKGKPTWSDCAIGYIVFYNRFFKDQTVEASVEAMKAATGDTEFAVWFGEQIKNNWMMRAQETLDKALSDPASSPGQGLGILGMMGHLPPSDDPTTGYITASGV